MGYKVAIVGATGNVGREMLNVLAERIFPISELYPLASRRSIGTEVNGSCSASAASSLSRRLMPTPSGSGGPMPASIRTCARFSSGSM